MGKRNNKMKIVMLWRLYPGQITHYKTKYPFYNNLSFKEHRSLIINEHFVWQFDLAILMQEKGIDVELFIVNDKALQLKWAKEHSFNSFNFINWEKQIAFDQVRFHSPNYLYVTSMFDYFGSF